MLLSVVIPVFNEAETLPFLLERLRRVLGTMDCEAELIFVNDGSRDETQSFLSKVAAVNPAIKVLSFSRNFGHQAALTAGLDFAGGDAVVIMDADLQDPPELLPRMLELYRAGYDVVSAQRVTRQCESLFKRGTARLFYWFMRRMVDERLPEQVGDFRLFSRAAVAALRQFREQHRFLRGMVAWLGLREAVVRFDRQPRAAGSTKYSLWKMLRFAWTAVSSFSALPLRLTLAFGALLAGGGFLYLAWAFYAAVVQHSTVPGWASLAAIQIVFSGAILMAIGLLGDYVARIYEEAKRRPLYVLSETLNVSQQGRDLDRAVLLPPHAAEEQLRPGSDSGEEWQRVDKARRRFRV